MKSSFCRSAFHVLLCCLLLAAAKLATADAMKALSSNVLNRRQGHMKDIFSTEEKAKQQTRSHQRRRRIIEWQLKREWGLPQPPRPSSFILPMPRSNSLVEAKHERSTALSRVPDHLARAITYAYFDIRDLNLSCLLSWLENSIRPSQLLTRI